MTTFIPQFLYILLTVIGGAYSLDADADLVKRSNSGLCHPPNSRWHERTKHYDAFGSLQACLESGGDYRRVLSKHLITALGSPLIVEIMTALPSDTVGAIRTVIVKIVGQRR